MSRLLASIIALTVFVVFGFTVSAVNPVNNPPSFTKGADQIINEDAPAQTINGWATNIDAGAGDSGQTLDFIVTNDNNQLFLTQPAVAANGALTYKSAANAFGVANVSVKLHDNGGGDDTSAPQTFKITVKPIADFPSATPATTLINTQTTSGLVIDRNAVDGPEVTHFRFFSITNGRLFKHDGVTEIPNGGIITLAEGQAGLRFTPTTGLFSPQTFFFFTVVAGLGPAPADFNSGFLTVGIGVTCTEAQVMVVTNSNDSGAGSLRDVLNNACSGSTVSFDMSPGHVTSPITLTSGELQIFQDQNIAGPTSASLVISGNNNSRIFNINQLANVKISNLTITGGKANSGGGIRSEGNLTIRNSTLTGNRATGTDGSGGALDIASIVAGSGSLLITNSTISGNTADNYGGGLRNSVTNATLVNVTITNNRADFDGDGFGFGGGMIQMSGPMNLRNTIVAGNFKGTGLTPSDLAPQLGTDSFATSSRNNLIGVHDTASGLDGAINLLGSLASPINPKLGSLLDNGGPARTHLLLLGSPAIKAGVNAAADGITTDERGFSRAASGPIDIGAVEVNYTISATGGTPQSAVTGNAFATPLQATVTESGTPQAGILVTFAAPANGASGSFSGSATVSTGANGVATAPAFTANSTVGGPYNVTASFAGGSAPAFFALTNTLPIAQVTLGNLVQTFDGNPKTVSVTTNPAGLTVAVTYNGSTTAPTNAGAYAVIATVNSPSFSGQASGNLVIQPGTQQITFAALANKKFGDADFGVSASASSNLTVTFSASGNCTVANALVHLTGAGACTLTASQNGNANWNPASAVPRTFTINKGDQQITFDALSNKTLGDPDFNLTAMASSNLAVSFSASGNCTTTNTLVHLTGAGACTITASQNGNANWNPATAVVQSFMIAKGTQQITFDALSNKKFRDPDFPAGATSSSNLSVSLAAAGNCTLTGSQVHLTGAGQCTITATQAGNADYQPAAPVARSFSIAKADQQITFAALSNKPAGAPDFNVTATASSNLAVSFAAAGSCTVAGTLVHLTGAGQCTITASQDGDANWNAATPVARSLSIGKADQQITFAALSNKAISDPDFAVSATASSGLAVAFSAAGSCTVNAAVIHLTGAGQCTITASQVGDANWNAATPVARSFSIGKADQQITFAPLPNKAIGDPDFNVTATASSNLAVSFSATGSCTINGTLVHLTGAGNCAITASQAGDATWNAATPVTRTFSIGKTDQQITFASLPNMKFGDADFGVTATASSGLAVVFSANGSCTVSAAQVHLTGAGQCTITASQDGDATWGPATPVAQTFTIGKADQQITFDPLPDKQFGRPDQNIHAIASSNLAVAFSAAGNCTLTGTLVHFAAAGQCTITATQEGNANFNAAVPVAHTFTIHKADQQITFATLPNRQIGDADFNVTATATSNLAVSFSATGNCTLAATLVHLTSTGPCTITAGQEGDANFNAAPDVANTFTIVEANGQALISFSEPVYQQSENGGSVTVTVTRTGDTTGAARVSYRTVDDPASIPCNVINGTSYARCDYATSLDTLNFAAGETSKTFVIPIIDDSYAEGNETFEVALSNPTGATLGAQATAMVTIVDNDAVSGPNPILAADNAGISFFVRQHYLDFLGREPEAGEPWSAVLSRCVDQFNANADGASAGCDRLAVSGSFFGSPEFLSKGVYTILFYRTALNRLPEYTEFAADLRGVVGGTPAETNAKRAAFANDFVSRPEFVNAYAGMTNAAFVNTLMQRYGLNSITAPNPENPDGPVKVTLTAEDLVQDLDQNQLTRAQALRTIVQSDEVGLNVEAINAFVASQYYGYLRRTPDSGGFNAWVNYLKTHPGDYRTMVHGFMNSFEYRLRFGPQ